MDNYTVCNVGFLSACAAIIPRKGSAQGIQRFSLFLNYLTISLSHYLVISCLFHAPWGPPSWATNSGAAQRVCVLLCRELLWPIREKRRCMSKGNCNVCLRVVHKALYQWLSEASKTFDVRQAETCLWWCMHSKFTSDSCYALSKVCMLSFIGVEQNCLIMQRMYDWGDLHE